MAVEMYRSEKRPNTYTGNGSESPVRFVRWILKRGQIKETLRICFSSCSKLHYSCK